MLAFSRVYLDSCKLAGIVDSDPQLFACSSLKLTLKQLNFGLHVLLTHDPNEIQPSTPGVHSCFGSFACQSAAHKLQKVKQMSTHWHLSK